MTQYSHCQAPELLKNHAGRTVRYADSCTYPSNTMSVLVALESACLTNFPSISYLALKLKKSFD